MLGADGVGLLTCYGDRWLGDAAFAPLFEDGAFPVGSTVLVNLSGRGDKDVAVAATIDGLLSP